ncbi:putative reverse transcriptase domain-containing protein [Tanacetum coccineum]|uniref:Reverse transcriptase domain-containing protein n=1 Tax=Tanacetum coccineum TaxID=301880 RepID=A0ABQ5CJ74_9ASTR
MLRNWDSYGEDLRRDGCNDALRTRLAVLSSSRWSVSLVGKAYKQAKGGMRGSNTLTWAGFQGNCSSSVFSLEREERLEESVTIPSAKGANENITEYMQRLPSISWVFSWGLLACRRAGEEEYQILRDREDLIGLSSRTRGHKREAPSIAGTRSVVIGVTVRIMTAMDPTGSAWGWVGGVRCWGYDIRKQRSTIHRLTSSDFQRLDYPHEGFYTTLVCASGWTLDISENDVAASGNLLQMQARLVKSSGDCKMNTVEVRLVMPTTKTECIRPSCLALTQDQAPYSGTITGTLFIFGRAVFVLFDTGATHSVISTTFASCFTMTPVLLDHVLCISTPLKDSARITHVYGDLPLQFDDKIRSVNAHS